MRTLALKTINHPQANGRTLRVGDKVFVIEIPLENNQQLRLLLGEKDMRRLQDFILEDMVNQPSNGN